MPRSDQIRTYGYATKLLLHKGTLRYCVRESEMNSDTSLLPTVPYQPKWSDELDGGTNGTTRMINENTKPEEKTNKTFTKNQGGRWRNY